MEGYVQESNDTILGREITVISAVLTLVDFNRTTSSRRAENSLTLSGS